MLSAVVAELDPDRVTGRDATDLYGSFAGLERLAVAGKTLLAPRIESSLVWRETGHRNAAVLLADLEGVSTGQAGATLSLGRRLEALPGTQEEVRKGTLSTPKVAELVDAGAVDPAQEAELVAGAADAPLQAVKDRCRQSRATVASADPLAAVRRIHASRRFTSWTDAEGAFCFQGRDTAERGAAILNRLGLSRHLPAQGGQGGRGQGRAGTGLQGRRPLSPSSPRARARPSPRVPAQPLLGAGLPTGPVCSHPGGAPRPRGRRPPSPHPSGPRRQEQSTRRRPPSSIVPRPVRWWSGSTSPPSSGGAHPGKCCAIDNLGPIPVPMARAMTNDSYLRYLFHQAGDIRAVSHFGRTINRTLRTALVHRDPACMAGAVGPPRGWRSTTSSPWPKADRPPFTIWPVFVPTTTISSRPTRDGTSYRTGTAKNGTPAVLPHSPTRFRA